MDNINPKNMLNEFSSGKEEIVVEKTNKEIGGGQTSNMIYKDEDAFYTFSYKSINTTKENDCGIDEVVYKINYTISTFNRIPKIYKMDYLAYITDALEEIFSYMKGYYAITRSINIDSINSVEDNFQIVSNSLGKLCFILNEYTFDNLSDILKFCHKKIDEIFTRKIMFIILTTTWKKLDENLIATLYFDRYFNIHTSELSQDYGFPCQVSIFGEIYLCTMPTDVEQYDYKIRQKIKQLYPGINLMLEYSNELNFPYRRLSEKIIKTKREEFEIDLDLYV